MTVVRRAACLLLAVCLWSAPCQAAGQTPATGPPPSGARNLLGLGWGYHETRVQDQLFSPLVYDGNGPLAVELFFRRQSETRVHFAEFGVDRTSVKSVGQVNFPLLGPRRASTASFFSLRLGSAIRTFETESLDLFLGGMFDNQIHVLDYRFAESGDEGYLLAYSLALWVTSQYRIDGRQTITGEVSYPVLSFLSRPPFAVVDNESIQTSGSGFGHVHRRGEWQAPGSFVKWHFRLGYVRSLSPRFDLNLDYRFDYMTVADPERLAIVRSGLNVAIALRL